MLMDSRKAYIAKVSNFLTDLHKTETIVMRKRASELLISGENDDQARMLMDSIKELTDLHNYLTAAISNAESHTPAIIAPRQQQAPTLSHTQYFADESKKASSPRQNIPPAYSQPMRVEPPQQKDESYAIPPTPPMPQHMPPATDDDGYYQTSKIEELTSNTSVTFIQIGKKIILMDTEDKTWSNAIIKVCHYAHETNRLKYMQLGNRKSIEYISFSDQELRQQKGDGDIQEINGLYVYSDLADKLAFKLIQDICRHMELPDPIFRLRVRK